MDATLTILIRAQARQAQQQIAATRQELTFMQRAMATLNRTSKGGFFEALGGSRLVKAGKNLQWLGRQMAYSFTLPVVLAGAALFQTTMEFEKSMTHLRKVYGSVEEDQAQLRRETDLLGESFRTMSTYFGVHVAEVAEIGGQWAAAGSAGRGLAENVKATLEAMILGDMEAEQATKSLIAIQAGWRLSTEKNEDGVSELTMALARLNIIENETGIGFEDLIGVYERAGGVARNAGFDFQQLGAFAAALVPATGGAAQAGTALRALISRLQSPTEQATEALRLMGIEVMSPAWMGAPVADRILMVADAYEDLSTANQGLVASVLASRWQVSRFSVMMSDLNSEFGYYQKALNASSDDTRVMETYQRELLEVLSSHPKRWEILKNSIRNTMMDAFIPMLPVIFEVIRTIAVLARAFSNLDPTTQKIIMLGLMFVALVGPIIMVMAAMMQLSGVMGTTLFFSLKKVFGVLGAVGSVFGYVGQSMLSIAAPTNALSLLFGGLLTSVQLAGQGLVSLGKFGGQGLIKGLAAVPTVLGHVATEVGWFAASVAKGVMAVPTVLSHIATEVGWFAASVRVHAIAAATWIRGMAASMVASLTSGKLSVLFGQIATEIGWFAASVRLHALAAAAWIRGMATSMMASLASTKLGVLFSQIAVEIGWFAASVKVHALTAAAWIRGMAVSMMASLASTRLGVLLSQIAVEIGWFAASVRVHTLAAVAWIRGMSLAMMASLAKARLGVLLSQIAVEIGWFAAAVRVQALAAAAWIRGMVASMMASLAASRLGVLLSQIAVEVGWFAAAVRVHALAAAAWIRGMVVSMMASLTASKLGVLFSQIAVEVGWFAASVRLHFLTIVASARLMMANLLVALAASRLGVLFSQIVVEITWFAAAVRVQFLAVSVAAKAAAAQVVLAWAAIGLPLWAVVAIVAAIVVALLAIFNDDFRNGIINAVKWVAGGLSKLPGVVATVFNTIIRFLAGAVSRIVEWLSYLNPFARHSPSLVDNVKNGVSAILGEYGKLNRIGGIMGNASAALQQFSEDNASKMRASRGKELREQAATPGVKGGSQIIESMSRLRVLLPPLAGDIELQEKVVQRMSDAYEMASGKIEMMQQALDGTKERLEMMTEMIDAANDRINDLADTPIKGMTELSDQIFENELAQNKLRMELLQFEKAGESIDSIRDKYAKLAGDIEMFRGKQGELSQAGAGADVLGVYEAQIDALEAQRGAMTGNEEKIKDIEDQLDALDIEGRFLALTKSINFDPLERQIERLVSGTAEMSFGDIVGQIQEQKGIIAQMEPIRQRLVDQVRNEEGAIDAATAAQDRAKLALDLQESKLDTMKEQYTDIEGLIRDMEVALSDVASTLSPSSDTSSFLDEMFAAGEGQNFDVLGDADILGRMGDDLDIEAFNKEMDALLEKSLGDLSIGDPFQPFKDKWTDFQEWNSREWNEFKDLWTEMPGQIWGGIVDLWGGIKKIFWQGFNAVTGFFSGIWDKIKEIWQPVGNFFSELWGAIKGIFWTGVNAVAGFFSYLWNKIKGIWNSVGVPIWNAIKTVISTLGTVVTTVFNAVVGAVQTAWGFVQPILMAIWGAIDGFVIPIFELFQVTALIVWELVSQAIQLAWAEIKWTFEQLQGALGWLNIAWDFMKGIVLAVWGEVSEYIGQAWADIETIFGWIQTGLGWLGVAWDILKDLAIGAWEKISDYIGVVWDLIEPIFETIQDWVEEKLVGAFNYLKDEVHKIWTQLGEDLQTIWDTVIKPVFGFFADIFKDEVKPAFDQLYRDLKTVMGAVVWIFSTAWNAIAASIENGINFFIAGFNKIGSAVNAVADLLDIDSKHRVSVMEEIHVKRIDAGISFKQADAVFAGTDPANANTTQFARGGAVGRTGAMVAGATALVGEGSNVYPEYIIPTDPKHRTRATALHRSLTNRLGFGGDIPAFASGGIFGDIGDYFKDTAKGAYDQGKGALAAGGKVIRKGAVEALWKPARSAIETIFNQIDTPMIRGLANGVMGIVEDWMSGSGAALDQFSSGFTQGTRLGGGEQVGNVQAAMARGGFVVPQTQGGSLFRIGEGLHNEAVQVTPLSARSGDGVGGTVNNFYGNLEFPNMNDPDDVETFLKNLEALAH